MKFRKDRIYYVNLENLNMLGRNSFTNDRYFEKSTEFAKGFNLYESLTIRKQRLSKNFILDDNGKILF